MRNFKNIDEYYNDLHKWVFESDKWFKHHMRKIYILVHHCGFNAEWLMDIPVEWFDIFYESWVSENEDVKKRQDGELEKLKQKQQNSSANPMQKFIP